MAYARFLLVTIVLHSLASGGAIERRIPVAPPCDFPAIYNFGDSNSDTGGFSAVFAPIPPPYGDTFFRRPAGRNSDGRLIIDFIAEHLRLPYLTSYLDSIGSNYSHGANFASGGATVRRQNGTIYENGISPFSLEIQNVQFDQFKVRTSDLYHEARDPFNISRLPRPRQLSKALYTLDIGQNDLAIGLRTLDAAQLRAALPGIVNQFAETVTRLYQQGARAFWIHNMRPIGCLPAASMYVEKPRRGFLNRYGCVRAHNHMAVEFNRQLKVRVIQLRKELNHAALNYVDIYRATYHLISNAEYYGFREPSRICCGQHGGNIHLWCGERTIINRTEIFGHSCGSPSTYISWDGMHYSQAANHWIANHILNGSFSDPPIPIQNACLKR